MTPDDYSDAAGASSLPGRERAQDLHGRPQGPRLRHCIRSLLRRGVPELEDEAVGPGRHAWPRGDVRQVQPPVGEDAEKLVQRAGSVLDLRDAGSLEGASRRRLA